MRAENELCVVVKDNVAVFFMFNQGWMDYLGGSCKSSLKVGNSSNSTITVSAIPGCGEVIAIKVNNSEGGTHKRNIFLIPITWEDGKMSVDLRKPFVSDPDRLLQVSIEGQVLMTTSKITFASVPAGMEVTDPSYCIVEDANLLFRFAVGHVGPTDLEAAVMLDKRDQLERNLAQAESAVERLRIKLAKQEARHTEAVGKLNSTIAELEEANAYAKSSLAGQYKEYEKLVCLNEKANDEAHQSRIHLWRIWNILNNETKDQSLFDYLTGFLGWVKVIRILEYFRKNKVIKD